MNAKIKVLVEIQLGQMRCGVDPKDVPDIAKHIKQYEPTLQFVGLQCYQGKNQHIRKYSERKEAVVKAVALVKQAIEDLRKDNIIPHIVTGGGTGTYLLEAETGTFTEVQPGSYIFMDVDYGKNLDEKGDLVSEFKNSLFILSTIISDNFSKRTPDRKDAWYISDCGMKGHSFDSGPPDVVTMDGKRLTNISYINAGDEHGKLLLSDDNTPFTMGDIFKLIPGHCDPTVNMHDWIVAIRNGVVEDIWRITARGPGL